MERYDKRSSAQSRALGNGISKANLMVPSPMDTPGKSPLKLNQAVPRNESLVDNGSLIVRNTLVMSPPNKHIFKVPNSDTDDSKRNSAVSTTSTNGSRTARKRKTNIGPWQLGKTVGKGGTARVRKVRHVITGQIGVAKIVARPVAEKSRALSLMNLVNAQESTMGGDSNIPLGLEREIAIMKLLDHPNIVRLYDVWENRNEIYLIMEFVEGGELFDFVARRQRLDEDVTVFLFRQIIAALMYCHRLHIHHRDLKPENILLDYKHMCVKLVDFGMAALQPGGRYLTTPCGSPHYAAPELLSSKAYDGGQADVWSCGVVLFVMLTGYPPFNFPSDPHNQVTEDRKLKALFRAIHRADYKMPPALSAQAQDLIGRIFVADPKVRITIDEIFHHPFIHKYDEIFAPKFGSKPTNRIESLIGPQPTINSWVPLTAKRIDPDIFRALRTLWHSDPAEHLIRRLCSDELNQEKYFYNAMLKYRETNLEDFQQYSTGIGYSASDYQHSRPAIIPGELLQGSSGQLPLAKSAFSICGSEHLQSRHSFYEIPVCEASYNPFRSSREPITKAKADLNVTVHRMYSGGNRKALHCHPGGSLRVDVFRRYSRRGSKSVSKISATSSSLQDSPASRRHGAGKQISRSTSRISVPSSHFLGNSPLTVIRPSNFRKRSVRFSYLRRGSTASALTSVAGSDALFGSSPSARAKLATKLRHPKRGSFLFAPSPAVQPHGVLRSRKENVGSIMPTNRTCKMRDIDQEAQKVSAELEKTCEEAFFRSSISSSYRTSFTEKRGPFSETPPSSLSIRSPYEIQSDAFFANIARKPLPPTPVMEMRSTSQTAETPGTYTVREVRNLREKLAAKYKMDGTFSDQKFNDVLNTLDMLMSPVASRQSGESQRIASAPQPHLENLDDTNYLSVIPEEGRFADIGGIVLRNEKSGCWPNRAFTEPHGRPMRPINDFADTTIRLVQPSSPPPSSPSLLSQPWAPLNIRKQSPNSSRSESRYENPSDDMFPLVRQLSKHDKIRGGYSHVGDKNKINSAPEASFREGGNVKLSYYVSDSVGNKRDRAQCADDDFHIQSSKYEHLNDRKVTRDGRLASTGPMKEQAPEKTRFFDKFKKKKTPQTLTNISHDQYALLAKDFMKATPNSVFVNPTMQTKSLMKSDEPSVNDNVSKLSRYLSKIAQPIMAQFAPFKPASAVIPLTIDRGAASSELITEIKQRAPGVVAAPKAPNNFTICCEVHARHIKGVKKNCSFDIEVFAIAVDEEESNMSVMRITLTKGSPVTLRQVALEIDAKLSSKGFIVKSKHLGDAICDTLGQGLRRSDWVYMSDEEFIINDEDRQLRVDSDRALSYAREMDKINPVFPPGDSRNTNI